MRWIWRSSGRCARVWALLALVWCATACRPAPAPAPAETTAAAPAPTAASDAPARETAGAGPTREGTVPLRDLTIDEQRGGHTLARHVGRTDAQLRQRLRDEPGISAASTYTDRDTAERVVALALTKSERKIAAWAARGGTRPNLTLNVHVDGEPIGRSIARRGTGAEPCHDAIVVLRARGDAYYVLTSYPEVR